MSENPSFSDDFKKIQEEYTKALPEKLQAISSLAASLRKEPSKACISELRTYVHQLAGNAATFGFQEATDLCKNWDAKLKEITDNFTAEKVQKILNELDAFIQQLKQIFKLA